jgi:hypothetical protein
MPTKPTYTMKPETKVVSVTLLPTGRVLMATESHLYELDGANIWQPMKFGIPVEPEPIPDPPGAAKPGLFGTPHPEPVT